MQHCDAPSTDVGMGGRFGEFVCQSKGTEGTGNRLVGKPELYIIPEMR